MNEFELIARFFSRSARVGDDCARLEPSPGMALLATADLLVEGRHFLPDVAPRALGHKALAVNLSDLAAAGARPRWALLSLCLPAAEEAWVAAFAEGLYALADAHGVELVGGDTTRGQVRTIGITALGEAPAGRTLNRAGARAGEHLWVSGSLGGASLGLVHPELPGPAKRLHEPEPRIALGARLLGIATACMDVSDGLAGDVRHLMARSGVGARIEYARIPKDPAFGPLADRTLEERCVLSGGDDYELLFTAPDSATSQLNAISSALGLALTPIGKMVPGTGLDILDENGKAMTFGGGFDHFGGR